MKDIKITEVKRELKSLLARASFELPEDIINAIKSAKKKERSGSARTILDMILENLEIARKEKLPLCQDCGNVYIDMEVGPDICITADSDEKADKKVKPNMKKDITNGINKIIYEINETVAEVYKSFYLRKSIVSDPLFLRKNTGSNLPAIINVSFSDRHGLGLEVNLKGGGSENCSWLFMLNPSATEKNIIGKVLSLVTENVTKACPPVIIGIGIGATASEVTKLARKAAFRNLEQRNADALYAILEEKILTAVNKTGIGPQGLGGDTTALACNIEFAPCHMATLPLAVSFGCHSTRRARTIMK
jgi:fumarate hydratase subunit alpha